MGKRLECRRHYSLYIVLNLPQKETRTYLILTAKQMRISRLPESEHFLLCSNLHNRRILDCESVHKHLISAQIAAKGISKRNYSDVMYNQQSQKVRPLP